MLMSVAEELEQVQFLLMSGRRIVTSIVSVNVCVMRIGTSIVSVDACVMRIGTNIVSVDVW